LPSSETQKRLILRDTLKAVDVDEDFYYVIPLTWWRKWCDYVNVEFKQLKDYAAE
jgi:hypothetical protein